MLRLDELRMQFERITASGEGCSLAEGALAIARIGDPDLAPEASLTMLDALADGVRARLADGDPVEQRASDLATYLFEERGFHGNRDDYYDPRNSFLNEVLTRRTGIPITLAIVWLEVGARVGVPLEGVGFPGHFLVRVVGSQNPELRDPFFGGRAIRHDELQERLRAFYAAGGGPAGANVQRTLPQALQTTGRRGMLTRVLGNLLAIYREREDHARALATVELMLVLAPDAAEYLRIRGLLYEQTECYTSALADFRRYLALAPSSPQSAEVRQHLEHLQRVSSTLH